MINSIKSFFNKIIDFFKKSDENISVEVEVEKKDEINKKEIINRIIKEEKPQKKQAKKEIKKSITKKEKPKEKIEKEEDKKKFKHSAIVDKDIWE